MESRVVLGFDIETDIGSWTPFYSALRPGVRAILETLSDNDVTATFFFTGAAAEEAPEAIGWVQEAGHEVGAHSLYHETLGDALWPIPGMMPLLPEEVPNRIAKCTELIEFLAGERPVSFRCPRLLGSTSVARALDELGYVADATLPMFCFRDRLEPYHPSAEDWTQPGSLRLLEIPNFADLSQTHEEESGRDLDQWPLFRTESAEALMLHIDGFVEYAGERGVETPVLCFYMHPWEFHPMPAGAIHYGEGSVIPDPFIVKNCGDYAKAQLNLLIRMLKQRGAKFYQARQLPPFYRGNL